ncbi:MAG: hypothetical protein IPK16_33510 [Anaerolineales bacterium]|nr:hypothetical protein [Anaerolineales bacterium]
MTRVHAALRQTYSPIGGVVTRVQAIDWVRWRWLLVPMAVFLVSRAVVLSGACLAEIAMPSQTGAEYWHAIPDNVLLDSLARWDSAFYLNIARDGYTLTPGQMSSVAFFPVYPLLMNLVSPLVGQNLVLAGVLVSHVMLLLALIFLYRLTEFEFADAGTAQRAVFYIAVFPTAIFFSAVYTESTFLFFSVATFYFARRHMWGWAGVMGILTSASRIVGVLVWVVVLYEWLRMHGWTLARIYRPDAWKGLWNGLRHDIGSLLLISMIPLGLISYMMFLKSRFNDPIAFWTTQSAWGRGKRGPFQTVFQDLNGLLHQNFATGEIWWNALLNIVMLFAIIVLALLVWRRFGAGFGIYTLLGVLIPAYSGTGSIIRYALVLFPAFMLLANWGRRPLLDRTILVVFTMFLGIFTAIFVNWIFLA